MDKVTKTDIPERTEEFARSVIGAAISVHRALGPGFLESVYEQAFCFELEALASPFQRQVTVPISYRDRLIGESRLDLVVGNCLIVELKAVDSLAPIHSAQLLSYLKATRMRLGLLINFNVPVLKSGIKRLAL